MKIRLRVNPSGVVRYQLDLGKINGKRQQKSFATREQAENFAKAKKEERKLFGTDALSLSEAERRQFIYAQEQLRKHGTTIGEAVTFFLRYNKPREPLTWTQMTERCYWDKLALNKRPKYVAELKRCAQVFGRAGHADKDASHIMQDDVERWLHGKGWSPKSRVAYLINLATVFSWGVEKGHVSINPCAKIQRPTIDDHPPGILTVPECARLLSAALATDSPTLKRGKKLQLLGYVSICLFAGVRPEEVQRMTWNEIHLEDQYLEVSALKSKTRRRRIVTISQALAAWLSEVTVPQGKIAPVNTVKRLRALRKLAGIEVWPHDVLRHSFASYHLAQHESAERTALQMGHAGTQMLFAHYRELVRPKDAAAFWALRHPSRVPEE